MISYNFVDEDDNPLVDKKKPGPKKGEGGRPTKKPFKMDMVTTLYSFGLTDEKVAMVLDVAPENLWLWKKNDPNFRKAVELGIEQATDNVERALYSRAVGFEMEAEEIHVIDKQIKRVQVVKKHPPSDNAAMYWLENKRPDKWKTRREIGLGGLGGSKEILLSVKYEDEKPKTQEED